MPLPSFVQIVGPGRLGGTAAHALRSAGMRVVLIGRGQPIPAAPLTWLTVPDRAIQDVARAVPVGGIVLHASGATDVSVLRPHRPAGSLHPLMTFPGLAHAPPPSGDVPSAVAGDPAAITAATELAMLMGWRPFEVSGDRRLYHASAVMAGNFATALLAEAAAVLVAAGVPAADAPSLLAPLALASLRNAAEFGPGPALTGPVARGDDAVIERHRSAIRAAVPKKLATYDAMLTAARALAQNKKTDPDD